MKGLEFDLTEKDIKIPLFCPVFTWIQLKKARNKVSDCSATIDRIDNSKGYIKGNVRVISFRANVLRKNGTARELIALALDQSKIEEKTSAQV